MRFGRGLGSHSRRSRGGIFFVIANERNPYEHFRTLSSGGSIQNVVGQEMDVDEVWYLDNYMDAISDKLLGENRDEGGKKRENYKKPKVRTGKFSYGLVDVEHPYFIEAQVEGKLLDESRFTAFVYLTLTGQKDKLNSNKEFNNWIRENMIGSGLNMVGYNKYEKDIATALKNLGYDAVVFVQGDEPLELFYFGRKPVRWLSEDKGYI